MAVFQHVAAVGELERLVGVLLHQEHRHAILAQLFDDFEDLLNDDRRQPQRRLVEQQQLGLAHQRAGDGEHLLFATGHGAAALLVAFLQAWEEFEHMVELLLEVRLAGEETAHGEVFLHRQPGEDPTAFRYHGNRLAHDVAGLLAHQLLALEANAAAARLWRTAERHQQGGFARTVGTDQSDDFALLDLHVDVVQGLDLAVEGRDVFESQHAHASPR